MSRSIEYDCEGCGIHVIGFGITAVPLHGFCAMCAWLCEFETPERIMELRRRCEPGGWWRERVMRSYRDPEFRGACV